MVDNVANIKFESGLKQQKNTVFLFKRVCIGEGKGKIALESKDILIIFGIFLWILVHPRKLIEGVSDHLRKDRIHVQLCETSLLFKLLRIGDSSHFVSFTVGVAQPKIFLVAF